MKKNVILLTKDILYLFPMFSMEIYMSLGGCVLP